MSPEPVSKRPMLAGPPPAQLPRNAGVVNVASVPHRSPFRYAGGKTWLVPFLRRWMATSPTTSREFYEPFCGGASVGLSMLFDGLVDTLVLVELDDQVAAVWNTILNGGGAALVDRIRSFKVTPDSVQAVLRDKSDDPLEIAFATIVRNRVQRGGILAPGASVMNKGENGRGLASRWYPETLAKRITELQSKRAQISFVHGDGLEWLACNRHLPGVYFFDPPYTVAGRRLYVHSTIDHEKLFRLANGVRGEFLMTYDDAPSIRYLASTHGFDTHLVPMKNRHHEVMWELLVGRDLGWARGTS